MIQSAEASECVCGKVGAWSYESTHATCNPSGCSFALERPRSLVIA
ncbi:hypothetical protein RE6C_05811 [Rhodopirellula europaea 6C]|uniref:Uncharacterized protein n=1 Tax=Rhodopirellula europaea 6C TaxID=1263867 RepID=M2AVA5_9BACT|nr:hypothetical protein RE6C_05811 [Rhodopirellula europaea 6C]